MRGAARREATVAVGFVLAAITETAARDHATPALLAFNATGALWLGALAFRRQRPLLTILVIAGAGVVGTTTTQLVWPEAPDGGGVWILALMMASYSLGAHGRGAVVVVGVLAPLVVVTAADLNTMSGWPLINGMLFATVFVGLLPTAAGRVVRVRRERVQTLRDQQDLLVEVQRVEQHSAVLGERLRAIERLQSTLVVGLRRLAVIAERPHGAREVEDAARALLTRTREEVVALTEPVDAAPVADTPPADTLTALRVVAQPWTVLAAGAVAAALYLETTHALAPATSWWLALGGGVAVGAPLALAWWRPVLAVALAWSAASAYSHLLVPLDGTLSDVGLGFLTAFMVATLSRRRWAVAGLVVCWVGQLAVVGADDPFGEGVLLLLCWLGGLAVNDASRLVEQARVNNELLAQQGQAYALSAVVEERLRLARELHDAIGHSLTVVALQAGAARRLAGTDPARAREVMRTVAAVAHDGVAALVSDERPADLAHLIEHVAATGLVVDADLADEELLDPAQRTVGVRVVQEALTNALRHAPGARVSVAVRRLESDVQIVIANSAPVGRDPGPGTGLGLSGLQERVAAAGGHLTWRLRADGGFEVRALLPAAALAESRS